MNNCEIIKRADVPAQLSLGEEIICADLNERNFTNLLEKDSGFVLMCLADKDCVFFKQSDNPSHNNRKAYY